jgi:hypothetical protein
VKVELAERVAALGIDRVGVWRIFIRRAVDAERWIAARVFLTEQLYLTNHPLVHGVTV